MLCYFPKTVVIMLYMLRIKGSNPFYVTVAGLTNITDLYILNILFFRLPRIYLLLISLDTYLVNICKDKA
jgi:hypothetical protein